MKQDRLIKFGMTRPTLDQLYEYLDLDCYDKYKVILSDWRCFDVVNREIVFNEKSELSNFIMRNHLFFVKKLYCEYDEKDNYQLVFELVF